MWSIGFAAIVKEDSSPKGDGNLIIGINISLHDIDECIKIYNAISRKEKPEFINEKVKEILDKCKIKTVTEGIGWRVI